MFLLLLFYEFRQIFLFQMTCLLIFLIMFLVSSLKVSIRLAFVFVIYPVILSLVY